MKKEDLLRILASVEARLPAMPCRLVPTSFDPDDPDLHAFPRSINWRWASCERALRALGAARGVMMRLPLFWQVEVPLHAACRAVGIPIFVNEPENMPVGGAAIQNADVDAVITDRADAQLFAAYLAERGIRGPRLWIVIHRADDASWDVPAVLHQENQRVAEEVHLFPGVPILEQCALLMNFGAPLFHLSGGYSMEEVDGSALLSGAEDDPLPLLRFELPWKLSRAGICSCGKATVERVPD